MTTFRAYYVTEDSEGAFSRSIVERSTDDLPEGELLIKVAYSSLNYKDALSAHGNKGVTRSYPHTPGIDAAGEVVESSSDDFPVGSQVIVTSYDLGMNTDGGFGQYIRVPSAWAVALPDGMSLKESMVYGTAGFTAALSLYQMERMGQNPSQGSVLVTGASGGVGSMAVAILQTAGYEVIASTGKTEASEYLMNIGATQVVDRAEADDESKRPLLRPKWAGAIDTVGDNTLATAIKACKAHGNVAACGLVRSPKLITSVFPFIINGVNLLGIDSANCDMETRTIIWNKLATGWKVKNQERIASYKGLDDLDGLVEQILKGQTQGRVVIDLWA